MIKTLGFLALALALVFSVGAIANNSSSASLNAATDVIGCDTCGCQDGEEACDGCCSKDSCDCESCDCTADNKEGCTCDDCCCGGCKGTCDLEESESEE